MTRNRFALLSSLAAAVVLGLLLWFLLGGGEEAGGRRPAEVASTAVSVKEEGPPLAPSTMGDAAAATGARKPAPDGTGFDLPAEPEAKEPTIPGLASLEDGTPLAGVEFWFGQGPGGGKTPVNTESAADGTFALPPDRPATVRHPWAVPVAAAGGTLDGDLVRAAADADRLLLTFRDRPGTAHVRLVDASTGVAVTDVTGLRMEWEFPGAVLTVDVPKDPGLGGWIPVTEGRLPDNVGLDPKMLRADPSKVTLVLSMPGFEAARLPLLEVRGRREVRVNPVEPDARGEVVYFYLGSSGIGDPRVTATLRSLDPDPQPVPPDLQGLPVKGGPFALYGLPDGAWEMEVTVEIPNGPLFRGRKSFERRGATADIGTIEVIAGGTVRIQVLDAADQPMPQAYVVAVRPDEDPDQGRPLHPDGEGRVVLADLEPGIDHRVQVRGLPRLLEQTVRAEPGKDAKEAVFRWPEKLVPCRITLVVDGKVVSNPDGSRTIPATIKESPLPRDRGNWGADGTFSADLVPGTYRFSAYATAKDGSGLVLFTGDVTVPSGESFETRLEMTAP